MERVSPTIHLVLRSCIFCTTLIAFLALLGAIRHKISFRGRHRQTLALLFKLVLDLVPVVLRALNSSKRTSLNDGTIQLVDSILLCCSYICITCLEHLFLWIITFNTGLGWVIHRPGVAVTIVINLSLFVPLTKWRNELYHFWTISGASSLHFSLFCFAHIWFTKHLQFSHKWSLLAPGYLACLIVALSSLTSLFVGWKVLRARDLLPEVSE
ncbi:hypothetical protein ABVK25_010804 [Lepraria finkii]|uniref:Uncharacterized protein n=1 Tax=Lepraria finkii TaxID=1340010 RepID=A0ABR4AVV7_9LECA